MKTEDIDKLFDSGASILPIAKLETARSAYLGRTQRRINLDMPDWAIQSLDNAAETFGVTRQSLIKMWLVDRLGQMGCTPPHMFQSDYTSLSNKDTLH